MTAIFLLAGALTAGAAACSGSAPGAAAGSGGPAATGWNADAYLDGIANDGINDPNVDGTQKGILERFLQDRTISEANWKEANNRYVDCMAGKGYTVEVQYLGEKTQTIRDAETAADEAELQQDRTADLECGVKASLFVNQLYAELNRPGGPMDPLASDRSIHQCYIENNVIPGDVTFEQFQAEGQKYFDIAKTSEEAAKCIQDAPV
ncbi:MAG: hypothetical protein LBU05_07700 [Bifidobacteriaceae bacterium]|jgi:hypothetical protein|nr:hypothetical protein [Bifidobacteriaceae bacterium]